MSLPCCVVERCVTEFILQNSHAVINQPALPGNDKLLRWKWGYPTPAYGYSLILTLQHLITCSFCTSSNQNWRQESSRNKAQVCRFGCGYYRREMVRRGLGTHVYLPGRWPQRLEFEAALWYILSQKIYTRWYTESNDVLWWRIVLTEMATTGSPV